MNPDQTRLYETLQSLQKQIESKLDQSIYKYNKQTYWKCFWDYVWGIGPSHEYSQCLSLQKEIQVNLINLHGDDLTSVVWNIISIRQSLLELQ